FPLSLEEGFSYLSRLSRGWRVGDQINPKLLHTFTTECSLSVLSLKGSACFYHTHCKGALLLLRSPRISTKPSAVFLYHLALTDGLLLSRWTLTCGHKLALCFDLDLENVLTQDLRACWIKEAWTVACNHLFNAHLFLGLLGLEATFVSRWPLQTRSIRTSHCARLGCTLVWILVLVELIFVMFSKTQSDPSSHSFFSMDALSFCLRKVLWLCDLWLHYNILYYKPLKRKSSFH
uniref:Uncharacterized protein n=1 Tax=Neogobius melanostomus TaxID=47308 RepID=A0A8C6ST83_9GOBI